VHIDQEKLPVTYIRRCTNPERIPTFLPYLTPYLMILDTCFKTFEACLINKKQLATFIRHSKGVVERVFTEDIVSQHFSFVGVYTGFILVHWCACLPLGTAYAEQEVVD
jgi:hypothetical protein